MSLTLLDSFVVFCPMLLMSSELSALILVRYQLVHVLFIVLLYYAPVPSISVWISDDGTSLITGEKYSLTCNISLAENLNATITYRWIKNNGTQMYYVVGTNSKILSFSSLQLSDAGKYFCEVIINSHLLRSAINETSKHFEVHVPGKLTPFNLLYNHCICTQSLSLL